MAEAEQPTTADQIETPTTTDMRAQLDDLITRAAAKDATKDHNAASELYSQATELQAELNGEMSPENADLLYAYGKSLYNVAVSKSDVLGSKVAGDSQPSSNAPVKKPTSAGSAATGESLVKNAISSSANKNAATPAKEVSAQLDAAPSKPFFQFTGDENFVDSDDEDAEENEEAEEEEEDDFENAFEVLDLARILYLKKLESAEEKSTDKGKGKSSDLPADLKHIKERLADTYDLQAEISLEGERFSDAVTDLRTALDLRNTLVPFEDPSVAECHYKLSLALEFASVQQQGEEDDGQEKTVDEEMRKEAATHMERAIESCKIRMASEEKKLEADQAMDEDKVTAAKRKISNVKEIIADMEQRVRRIFCLVKVLG
jgi:HAT1-interacting factor 1